MKIKLIFKTAVALFCFLPSNPTFLLWSFSCCLAAAVFKECHLAPRYSWSIFDGHCLGKRARSCLFLTVSSSKAAWQLILWQGIHRVEAFGAMKRRFCFLYSPGVTHQSCGTTHPPPPLNAKPLHGAGSKWWEKAGERESKHWSVCSL